MSSQLLIKKRKSSLSPKKKPITHTHNSNKNGQQRTIPMSLLGIMLASPNMSSVPYLYHQCLAQQFKQSSRDSEKQEQLIVHLDLDVHQNSMIEISDFFNELSPKMQPHNVSISRKFKKTLA